MERLNTLEKSLPLRKCGLKQNDLKLSRRRTKVTSLAEVWIETTEIRPKKEEIAVTSLAEVWIETILKY